MYIFHISAKMLNIFHQHPLVTTTTTTTSTKGPTSGSPSVSMTFEMDGIRVGFSQQLPYLHHLKRIAKAPDNKAGTKGNFIFQLLLLLVSGMGVVWLNHPSK